nr:hypothetical protein [Thermoproteota archaeon]
QRLNKVGLSKYAALLHDPVNDRQELYRQMSRLLNFGSRTITTNMPSYPLAWQFIESKISELSKSID